MGFINEKTIKAVRKARRCCACGRMVNAGAHAVCWTGVVDGDFNSVIYHPDCRAAEIRLNYLHGGGSYDWCSLHDIESDDYQWLLDEFPAVAERFAISRGDHLAEAAQNIKDSTHD